jgi:MFS family permease
MGHFDHRAQMIASRCPATTYGRLFDLIRSGKVRAIGASQTPAPDIIEAQWVAERRGLERPHRAAAVLGNLVVLTLGAAAFAGAFIGFALTGPTVAVLAICFCIAGLGIGFAETAENAAVAAVASKHIRGSAFGALATIQSLGNFAASAIAGLLYTLESPRAAFLYLATWMIVAVVAFAAVRLRAVRAS